MAALFPKPQTSLQDCNCKNTYVDSDYVILPDVRLETKLAIIQEFRDELNPEVIDTNYAYAYVNGHCASIDFQRTTSKGQEWLAVLLNPETWEAELDTMRHRFAA